MESRQGLLRHLWRIPEVLNHSFTFHWCHLELFIFVLISMLSSCCARRMLWVWLPCHVMMSRDNILMRRVGKMHGTWIKSASCLWNTNFIRLQMSCVSVVVQSWPTAGPFHQAVRKPESQGVHDQFFIYFFAVQDLDWGAVANHPPSELVEQSVCMHMYAWPYCTSLIVLHNVKYTVCTEQAVEQEVAQCVLFSMGDSDIHLQLGKAWPVIQKSPPPSFKNAFPFVFPLTCAI